MSGTGALVVLVLPFSVLGRSPRIVSPRIRVPLALDHGILANEPTTPTQEDLS